MDVLHCDTYEVNGRVYRRNVPLNLNQGPNLRGDFDLPDQVEDDEYDSDLDYEGNVDNIADECVDEADKEGKAPEAEDKADQNDDHYPIKFNAIKRAFTAEITVPDELMGKLIGAKGSNKKLIEDETGAKLQIPRRDETGPVVITSANRESVERCYDRVEMLILDNRRRLNFTHFVLIPIESAELMKKHEKIVDDIRSSGKVDESCKDPSLFVTPNRLHLTVAPLWLFSSADMNKAKKAVQEAVVEFKAKSDPNEPLKVSIKGLSHFGGEDVDHVRVIYGKVNSSKIQELADMICKALTKSGQGEAPRGGNVKLHMTILNTKYLAMEENPEKQYVDATGLFKEFGNVDYGTVVVDQVGHPGNAFYDLLYRFKLAKWLVGIRRMVVFGTSRCSKCKWEPLEKHYTDIGLILCIGLCGFCCIGPCLAYMLRRKHCQRCFKKEFQKTAPLLRKTQCYIDDKSTITPPGCIFETSLNELSKSSR
ncbi:hypothetical protein FO519_005075 [Halicephalobus sp. NKZ332]|nr:hypothetical protein FO519_005075 [Halicephalobus sp. NKZ332]